MHAAQSHRSTWLWMAALVAVMAAYAWATYAYRFTLVVQWGDTWVHLALIRRTMEYGWFPGDAFYAEMPTPPYYSLAHIGMAALSAATGAPPHEVLVALPPLVAVATVAAVFAWLRALTGDVRVAVIGAATELLIQAPDPTWWVMPYPRALAVAPLAFTLLCYWHARRRGSRGWLVAAGVTLGICAATHLFIGVFAALGLLCLELALSGITPRAGVALLIANGIALLVSAPWLVNVLQRWRERELLVPVLFSDAAAWQWHLGSIALTSYTPGAVLDALPAPLWVPALLGLFFCVKRWTAGTATATDRYAVIATIVALLLLLTPLYGLLLPVAGAWTGRLVRVVPLALLIGLGISGTIDTVGDPTRRRGVRRALGVAAACAGAWLAGATAAAVRPHVQIYAPPEKYIADGPLGDWQLEDALAATGALPQVVLSDPWTSYLLPYYLGTAVVTMPAGHGSAYVDHQARARAAARVFNRHTPMSEIYSILNVNRVDMLAISRSSDWPTPGAATTLLERLQRDPAFADTGCCGDIAFLRYRGAGTN